MKKPEILSPAGDFEKMKAAVRFGADAVYLSGKSFGMRSGCGNFTPDEMAEAIAYARKRGVKVYITLNTMPRNDEYAELEKYVPAVCELRPDAFIVADLGVMSLLHRLCPDAVIHVSTQTSIVSSYAALEYVKNYNAKRLVLARELSLCEIREIRKNVPEEIELEAFVHGAMCVSYSGRCLLSNHFTGRDGNRGMCAQPCRWNYKLYSLGEERDETRAPGVMQTEEGTFIMSSRDMCMIEHIPELCEAGISSFKIEGRMKSVYYAAATAYAYRHALDLYFDGKAPDPSDRALLESVTHREYDTGYYFDSPSEDAKTVTKPGYITERPYYGIVLSYDGASQTAKIKQKNKLFKGDRVSFLTPDGVTEPFAANEMRSEDGEEIDSAPHPKQVFSLKTPYPVGEGDLLLP